MLLQFLPQMASEVATAAALNLMAGTRFDQEALRPDRPSRLRNPQASCNRTPATRGEAGSTQVWLAGYLVSSVVPVTFCSRVRLRVHKWEQAYIRLPQISHARQSSAWVTHVDRLNTGRGGNPQPLDILYLTDAAALVDSGCAGAARGCPAGTVGGDDRCVLRSVTDPSGGVGWDSERGGALSDLT